MATLVSDLIQSAFRLLGGVASGETLETQELNDAFATLNQMIASWNTEGLSLVARKRLTVATNQTNGPFSLTERPVRIVAASHASGGIDSKLDIVDADEWEQTPEKLAQTVYVRKLYCDYAYPTASVYIAPVPRLTGSLEVWIYAVMPAFASVSATIDLPPGYEAAIRYNLAVALLPEYPREAADPSLPAQAQQLKASLVSLNQANQQHGAQAPAGAPQ